MSAPTDDPPPPATLTPEPKHVQPVQPGYRPGDDAGTRWRNRFSLLLGRMSDEDKKQYLHDRDVRYEAQDCERCEKWRDFSLNYSPTVRFMTEHLQKLGGDMHRENIQCRRCDNPMAGAFDPRYGILLCANHLRSRAHAEETIAHEMVHAWDHLRYKVDWTGNLRHAACTEIRASTLSGECRWTREFWSRGQYRLARQHQNCVKRRAVISVQGRPFCKDREHAERVVDEVWESCFKDTRPFDEIYR